MIQLPRASDLNVGQRSLICNGIGPAPGSGAASRIAYLIAVPFLFVARRIGILHFYKSAGDDHDLHYHLGGTYEDKRIVDGIFLGRLIHLSARWPLQFRPLGWAISLIMWMAVALGGWGAFVERDRPHTLSDLD